jgi:hypothetical protein
VKAHTLASSAGALLVALLPTGCGSAGPGLDQLDGRDVATMAERELETENPGLAPGTLACPDLDYRIRASVRCLRTAELGDGRVVKVGGTVEVTSIASGGHLHVTMDDDAEEFGVAGANLGADLRRRYVQQFHVEPSQVTCPYLRAVVGHRVTCRVVAGGVRRDVEVVVTAADAETYRTVYRTTYVGRPRGTSS